MSNEQNSLPPLPQDFLSFQPYRSNRENNEGNAQQRSGHQKKTRQKRGGQQERGDQQERSSQQRSRQNNYKSFKKNKIDHNNKIFDVKSYYKKSFVEDPWAVLMKKQ